VITLAGHCASQPVHNTAIVWVFATLILLFSFEGKTIFNDPLLVAYLASPNLIHYSIMITWASFWFIFLAGNMRALSIPLLSGVEVTLKGQLL
jgi:ACR3 family arsenite efflux pump ArsB